MNKDTIRGFLLKQKKNSVLEDDDDLFKGGYVNSIFALQLVMFLEKEFSIKITNKDINEDNFRTVNAIWETVERLMEKSKK